MIATVALVALVAAGLAARPRAPRRGASATVVHAPRRTTRRGRAALARTAERAYPHAIELVVLAVRAGHLPSSALRGVAPHLEPPLREAFEEVARRTATGERFADALATLPDRLGTMAAPLADSFAAADRYGLPLAPVLERLADEARQRRRRQADALARQLPVRLSLPLVLCTLPSFVLLAVAPLLLAALSSLQR